MTSPLEAPFISPTGDPIPLPVDRFLPPLSPGMVSGWLQRNVSPGSWIIDPFGTTPALALEAARAGYRVLIASNNPVVSFIMEVQALAPSQADFMTVLAEISSLRRGSERLEPHLKSLYQTECPSCGQTIPAQGFLWKREENHPFARLLHCSICGSEGEYSVTPRDLETLTNIGQAPLHRARAIERLGIDDSDVQESVQEALNTYLSRSLYFLFTLINRSEGLSSSPERQQLLQALILSVCDQGNSLWPWPASRNRPRQLVTPPQYREHNLWLSLEEAWKDWVNPGTQVPFSRWPELPPGESGICLYPGRLRNLLPIGLELSAALTVFPRPNQAFWTLSTLWSAWIWGRSSTTHPLLHTMERRRYDWAWHTSALHNTLAPLAQYSPSNFKFFGILSDLAPGFLSAAMIASTTSGFNLDSFSLRENDDIAQITWKKSPNPNKLIQKPPQKIIKQAIVNHLEIRKQPAPYLLLHSAALVELCTSNHFDQGKIETDGEMLNHTQAAIHEVFGDQNLLQRYESQAQTLESGLWWMVQPPPDLSFSLMDQVEMEIVNMLGKGITPTWIEIDRWLCDRFPGLTVPPSELIESCLASYAEIIHDVPPRWKLAERESPSRRRSDIKDALENLSHLAKSLGFISVGDNPTTWCKSGSEKEPQFSFNVIASSVISRFIHKPTILPAPRCVIVLPGSRSRLLMYKLHKDPYLNKKCLEWQFLKFRHLRTLAEHPDLDLAQFESMITIDQPEWEEARQGALFD